MVEGWANKEMEKVGKEGQSISKILVAQVRFPGLEWLGSGLDGGYPDYDPYGACIESISPTDFSV